MAEEDKNTKYFYICASNKQRKNFIAEIQNDGNVYRNQPKIHKTFLDYYTKLLGSTKNSMVETDWEALYPKNHIDLSPLESPFSETEIKDIIFNLPRDKTPSPNRFPISSYQKH